MQPDIVIWWSPIDALNDRTEDTVNAWERRLIEQARDEGRAEERIRLRAEPRATMADNAHHAAHIPAGEVLVELSFQFMHEHPDASYAEAFSIVQVSQPQLTQRYFDERPRK